MLKPKKLALPQRQTVRVWSKKRAAITHENWGRGKTGLSFGGLVMRFGLGRPCFAITSNHDVHL